MSKIPFSQRSPDELAQIASPEEFYVFLRESLFAEGPPTEWDAAVMREAAAQGFSDEQLAELRAMGPVREDEL